MLLVTGAGGQVGRELVRAAAAGGHACQGFDRAQLDITDADRVAQAVADHSTGNDVLINLAAFTSVDAAETDPDTAWRVNAHGVALLAAACARAGIPMIHVSTDYVFPGSTRALSEADPTGPLNEYGRSKLAGEHALREQQPAHLVVRTSWVFGRGGRNFVPTMLRLAQERAEVAVVADEVGCPTAGTDLAATLLELAVRAAAPGFGDWGTYHCCGRPAISRADFARVIFENARQAGLATARVREITAAEFPSPARRPGRSVLDCSRLERVFGIRQPEWRPALRTMLAALSAEAPHAGS